MKIKVFHILLLCMYITSLYTMETSYTTEHKKTLSPEDLKIRDYFFGTDKLGSVEFCNFSLSS